MTSVKRIIILLIVSCISFSITQAQENASFFLHTIEKGQNVYSIANMYDVSQEDIFRMNPGSDQKIYAGQTLKIPQVNLASKDKDKFHTIQPGETLYRLTIMYGLTAKEICDENPGLSAENFKAGEVIRIPPNKASITVAQEVKPEESVIPPAVKPRCKDMHKVKRKETVFSISRKYKITEQELIAANPELKDGMKKGQYLCIPYPAPKVITPEIQDVINPPSDRELFSENKETAQKLQTVKAAVILPFVLDSSRQSEATRMIDFYEGFLVAVDSLKRSGYSFDIYTYDSGSEDKPLTHILMKPEMKDMDIIFGPLYPPHIKSLAKFAEDHHIRLVVPFTSKDTEVFSNPSIYQVNTPQSYQYSEVYDHFVRQFPNANVILLETDDKDQKKEFVQGLIHEMNNRMIPVQLLPNAHIQAAAMKAALNPEKVNVFVPTSGSAVALKKIIPQMRMMLKSSPGVKITMFGYPEWQTYINDHIQDFFDIDTYFYSSFYTNNLLPAPHNFIQSYRQWYSKDVANTYPKYAMLGFDTGYYFLKGLSMYGTGFENKLSEVNVHPIQTGFKFDRVNNWGGFINRKVFFVRFTREYELIKLDFD